MRSLIAACAAALLVACSPTPQEKAAPATPEEALEAASAGAADVPAGDYTLDKTHASLIFRISHLGFSNYTASFDDFGAVLSLDPAAPETARLEATVDVRSLELDNPPEGFTQESLGPNWLDAQRFPTMVFRSTSIERSGANKARITGDFTMHGVTKPLTLEATYNGGYRGHPMDPRARIGFSATGVVKRSDYGVSLALPAPGSQMGVGDEVSIIIEAEFNGPPMQAP